MQTTTSGMPPDQPSAVAPDFDAILCAAARIAPHVHATPVLRSRTLDGIAGCEMHFKCENLQRTGAFKFRGACNTIFSLTEAELARGVVTQSSGNHGAAVALACRLRRAEATVVVPRTTSAVKLAAMRGYGARVIVCDPTQAARDKVTAEVLRDTGGVLVHPFNDARVIAGQGTAALELLHTVANLDMLVTPVSGGGLLSGTALTAHGIDPAIEVLGAEPEGARDAHDSLQAGTRITGRVADTICDGLRAELGTLTFPIVQAHVRTILLIDDARVAAAMRLLWERMKLVVEPSAAVALAVVLANPERFAGRRVGIIVSGGNIDLDGLPALLALADTAESNG